MHTHWTAREYNKNEIKRSVQLVSNINHCSRLERNLSADKIRNGILADSNMEVFAYVLEQWNYEFQINQFVHLNGTNFQWEASTLLQLSLEKDSHQRAGTLQRTSIHENRSRDQTCTSSSREFNAVRANISLQLFPWNVPLSKARTRFIKPQNITSTTNLHAAIIPGQANEREETDGSLNIQLTRSPFQSSYCTKHVHHPVPSAPLGREMKNCSPRRVMHL